MEQTAADSASVHQQVHQGVEPAADAGFSKQCARCGLDQQLQQPTLGTPCYWQLVGTAEAATIALSHRSQTLDLLQQQRQ